MAYTPTNWQDGVTPVNAVNMNKLEQGLAAAVGIPADVVVTPATAHLIRNRLNAADTQPAFRMLASGRQEFGAGGASAADVSLYRSGAGQLQIDGKLAVFGSLLWTSGVLDIEKTAGNQIALEIYQTADANDRLSINSDGKHQWGPGGATPVDTNLYRSGAGTLRTDGALTTGGGFWADGADGDWLFSTWHTGDTQSFWRVERSGKTWWGPGGSTAADTNLYRLAAGILKTDGQFIVQSALVSDQSAAASAGIYMSLLAADGFIFAARKATDTQWRVLLNADGKMSWGPGGSASVDTDLYRVGVGALYTGGALTVAGQFSPQGLVWMEASTYVTHWNAASGWQVLRFRATGEANNRFALANTGRMDWGDGTAVADTALYRSAAGSLRTDGNLTAAGTIASEQSGGGAGFRYNPSTATGWALYSHVGAEANPRFSVEAAGKLNWGPGGSTAVDTNLYRSGANSLKTDGGFQAVGDISSRHGGAGRVVIGEIAAGIGGIYLGGALDTYLYRAGAALVKTDGALAVGNYLQVSSLIWSMDDTADQFKGIAFGSAQDTKLFRSSSGVLRLNGQTVVVSASAGTKQMVQYGIAQITGGATATATFSPAFSAPPSVTLGTRSNTDVPYLTNDPTASAANIGVAGSPTFKVHWIAVGPA